jgi:hypothetical protein
LGTKGAVAASEDDLVGVDIMIDEYETTQEAPLKRLGLRKNLRRREKDEESRELNLKD